MPSRSTYTLLRVRGIPVGVDWSWFLVLFIAIWWLTGFYQDTLGSPEGATEPYVLAVVTALLFFGSILLHELGHAVVALRNGVGISHITLWMFGGVAGLERDSRSPGEEFRIAVAGPVVTFAIAAACLGVGLAMEGSALFDVTARDPNAGVSGAVAVLAWLANINILILLFNLLPAFPLDGGRMTRAIAWKVTGDRETGTTFAARLGQGLAMLMIGAGVYLAFATDLFITGIWLAVIGWMLGSAARATVVRSELNRRIGDVSVADVMDDDPVAIPEDASVESALDEYFLRYEWPWFPVVDRARRFVGMVNRGAADAVPEPVRATQRVSELLEPGPGPGTGASETVRDDEPLEALLGNSELRRLGGLAAVDREGRLSGVITLEQVTRALRDAVGGGAEIVDPD